MPNKQKILIAEDNPDGREIIVLFVKSLGLEVFEATTGLQALNQTRAVHPDLILMDLGLPEMPGDEVMARLKDDPSTREIPVIVVTALPKDGTSVESAIAAGAAEILHKPTSLKALEEVMRRYLCPPP